MEQIEGEWHILDSHSCSIICSSVSNYYPHRVKIYFSYLTLSKIRFLTETRGKARGRPGITRLVEPGVHES